MSEQNIDSEDLAMFYESLKLLHSPKIDSQRKLYHLVIQSIRKHHPTSNPGFEKKSSDASYSGETLKRKLKETEEITGNIFQTCEIEDSRINKEVISIEKENPIDGCYPKKEVKSENKVLSLKNRVTGSHAITPAAASSSPKVAKNNMVTNKPIDSFQSFSVSAQNNRRIAHSSNSEQMQTTKQSLHRPSPKALARHKLPSYCPNPVNLKKIRAALTRGDPFPIHLTKACINNITPDLQREKL